MATFLYDTFSDGTKLDFGHTVETGGPWTRHADSASGDSSISGGKLFGATFNRSYYYAAGTPASAEYDVIAEVECVTAGSDYTVGVLGRVNPSTTFDGYMARYSAGASKWQLYKFVAGTATLLGEWAETLVATNVRTLKLEIRNAAKKVYINGTERISSADNSITAAGKAGVGVNNGNGTYAMLDITATDAAGGAAGLFRSSPGAPLSGLGSGGKFFQNPLG